MNKWLTLVLLLATSVALALRYPRLDPRPMHNDEAVNAIKFGQLWEHGSYQYDPNEHHGPSLYYATLALGRLTRAPDFGHFTEARLRALTVLCGVGLIPLLLLVVDGLGKRAVVGAAFFTAVSPAMVFYSGYYIHEMLLVFFTFLAIAAGWRYWRSRKVGWAILAGAGIGLMHATKETFVITLFCAALALALNHCWNRFLDASAPPLRLPRWLPGTWLSRCSFGLRWRWCCSPPSLPMQVVRWIQCAHTCPGFTVRAGIRPTFTPGRFTSIGCCSSTWPRVRSGARA